MPDPKNIEIQSKFRTLELLSFNVASRDVTADPQDPDKITFEISINFNIDHAKKILVYTCQIKIFGEIEKQTTLGSIETKAEFEVLNLDKISDKEKGIPTGVMATFVGLLISSSRGMLSILSRGTSFEKGIIPIINPMVFFPAKS